MNISPLRFRAALRGACEALTLWNKAGGKVVLLTNSPRPKFSVINQLETLAVPTDAWDIIATSGDAAQMGMLSGAVGHKVHHIGAPKDEVFFTDFAEDLQAYAKTQPPITRVALKDAEGIVCTGLVDGEVAQLVKNQEVRPGVFFDFRFEAAVGSRAVG